MNIMFLFLAVLATIVTWWLSQQRITAKPWLEANSPGQAGAATIPAAKIGLGVFLAVVGALFALLFSAYSMRMEMGGWRAAPAPNLLWFNTAVLILSSSLLQWASVATRGRNLERVRAWLLASGVLALAFLAGQLLAWRQLDAAGYYLTGNPAAAFFFLITGLHGLHLMGGLGGLGRTIDKTWKHVPMRELRLSVELCALYWHFLLLVWLVFFGLLLLSDGSASTSSLVSLICRVF